jgi:hypothetical protein
MNSLIGEPVAGYSSSTNFGLGAGFFAIVTATNDDIFFAGFEDCTP